jgi:hypothetical protein
MIFRQHNGAQSSRRAEFGGLGISFNDFIGALGEIRTPDPQIRSLMLYPAELRARQSHISA